MSVIHIGVKLNIFHFDSAIIVTFEKQTLFYKK